MLPCSSNEKVFQTGAQQTGMRCRAEREEQVTKVAGRRYFDLAMSPIRLPALVESQRLARAAGDWDKDIVPKSSGVDSVPTDIPPECPA
jgi:hypothetical protein